jgi:hypothetical protein
MTDLARRPLDDEGLASALRDLATAIDWPDVAPAGAGPDLATRVRVAIGDRRSTPGRRMSWRPARIGLILALIALLGIVAVAGAVVLGLPGLRISFGDPGTPPPAASSGASAAAPSGPPGTGMRLGIPTTLAEASAAVGRPIGLPTDPAIGAPDAIWLDRARSKAVAAVWAPTGDLPATLDPDVGMVLMTFDGTLDDGYFQKIADLESSVELVTVDGHRGFWISGDPHFFFYVSSSGASQDDPRRWVGDALVWSDGTTTWRLETAAGREAALRIAESLR